MDKNSLGRSNPNLFHTINSNVQYVQRSVDDSYKIWTVPYIYWCSPTTQSYYDIHPQHLPAYDVQPHHRSSYLQPQFAVDIDLVTDATATYNMQLALSMTPDQMVAIEKSIHTISRISYSSSFLSFLSFVFVFPHSFLFWPFSGTCPEETKSVTKILILFPI